MYRARWEFELYRAIYAKKWKTKSEQYQYYCKRLVLFMYLKVKAMRDIY